MLYIYTGIRYIFTFCVYLYILEISLTFICICTVVSLELQVTNIHHKFTYDVVNLFIRKLCDSVQNLYFIINVIYIGMLGTL